MGKGKKAGSQYRDSAVDGPSKKSSRVEDTTENWSCIDPTVAASIGNVVQGEYTTGNAIRAGHAAEYTVQDRSMKGNTEVSTNYAEVAKGRGSPTRGASPGMKGSPEKGPVIDEILETTSSVKQAKVTPAPGRQTQTTPAKHTPIEQRVLRPVVTSKLDNTPLSMGSPGANAYYERMLAKSRQRIPQGQHDLSVDAGVVHDKPVFEILSSNDDEYDGPVAAGTVLGASPSSNISDPYTTAGQHATAVNLVDLLEEEGVEDPTGNANYGGVDADFLGNGEEPKDVQGERSQNAQVQAGNMSHSVEKPAKPPVTVLLVGLGFAGLNVVRKLGNDIRYNVIAVDPRSYFEYSPGILRTMCSMRSETVLEEFDGGSSIGSQTSISFLNRVDPQMKSGFRKFMRGSTSNDGNNADSSDQVVQAAKGLAKEIAEEQNKERSGLNRLMNMPYNMYRNLTPSAVQDVNDGVLEIAKNSMDFFILDPLGVMIVKPARFTIIKPMRTVLKSLFISPVHSVMRFNSNLCKHMKHFLRTDILLRKHYSFFDYDKELKRLYANVTFVHGAVKNLEEDNRASVLLLGDGESYRETQSRTSLKGEFIIGGDNKTTTISYDICVVCSGAAYNSFTFGDCPTNGEKTLTEQYMIANGDSSLDSHNEDSAPKGEPHKSQPTNASLSGSSPPSEELTESPTTNANTKVQPNEVDRHDTKGSLNEKSDLTVRKSRLLQEFDLLRDLNSRCNRGEQSAKVKIVGAGTVAIEMAGELLHYFPNIEVYIELKNRNSQILPEFPASARDYVLDFLSRKKAKIVFADSEEDDSDEPESTPEEPRAKNIVPAIHAGYVESNSSNSIGNDHNVDGTEIVDQMRAAESDVNDADINPAGAVTVTPLRNFDESSFTSIELGTSQPALSQVHSARSAFSEFASVDSFNDPLGSAGSFHSGLNTPMEPGQGVQLFNSEVKDNSDINLSVTHVIQSPKMPALTPQRDSSNGIAASAATSANSDLNSCGILEKISSDAHESMTNSYHEFLGEESPVARLCSKKKRIVYDKVFFCVGAKPEKTHDFAKKGALINPKTGKICVNRFLQVIKCREANFVTSKTPILEPRDNIFAVGDCVELLVPKNKGKTAGVGKAQAHTIGKTLINTTAIGEKNSGYHNLITPAGDDHIGEDDDWSLLSSIRQGVGGLASSKSESAIPQNQRDDEKLTRRSCDSSPSLKRKKTQKADNPWITNWLSLEGQVEELEGELRRICADREHKSLENEKLLRKAYASVDPVVYKRFVLPDRNCLWNRIGNRIGDSVKTSKDFFCAVLNYRFESKRSMRGKDDIFYSGKGYENTIFEDGVSRSEMNSKSNLVEETSSELEGNDELKENEHPKTSNVNAEFQPHVVEQQSNVFNYFSSITRNRCGYMSETMGQKAVYNVNALVKNLNRIQAASGIEFEKTKNLINPERTNSSLHSNFYVNGLKHTRAIELQQQQKARRSSHSGRIKTLVSTSMLPATCALSLATRLSYSLSKTLVRKTVVPIGKTSYETGKRITRFVLPTAIKNKIKTRVGELQRQAETYTEDLRQIPLFDTLAEQLIGLYECVGQELLFHGFGGTIRSMNELHAMTNFITNPSIERPIIAGLDSKLESNYASSIFRPLSIRENFFSDIEVVSLGPNDGVVITGKFFLACGRTAAILKDFVQITKVREQFGRGNYLDQLLWSLVPHY